MLKKIGKFIRKLVGKKETIVTPLDPEQVKTNQTIGAQQQVISSLKAELGRHKAKEHQEKEDEKKKDKEQELIKKLREEEREIKKKVTENSLSLTKLLRDIVMNKNYKNQIEVTDREGKEVLTKFGDICIVEGEYLALFDNNRNAIVRGKELRHIIFKPESLANYVRRKQIPIPYILDKKGNLKYEPDLDNLDFPEMSYNKKDNKFDIAQEKYDKVKNLLIKKSNEINELRKTLERSETIIIELKSERDDLSRANKTLENQRDVSQSHLSRVVDKSIQFEAKVGDMQRDITNLMEQKVLSEEMIFKLENINKALIQRFEDMGMNTRNEIVLRQLQDLIDYIEPKVAKTITQVVEPEKKEATVVQPGQFIGKGVQK